MVKEMVIKLSPNCHRNCHQIVTEIVTKLSPNCHGNGDVTNFLLINVSYLCPAGCEDLGDVPGPLRSPLKQTEIFKGERATLLIIFEQD